VRGDSGPSGDDAGVMDGERLRHRMAADTWLVVGLGNPGSRYEATRHNIGYLVVDELLGRTGGRLARTKARAQAATVRMPGSGGVPGARAVLVRPATYMNESGQPV